MKYSCPAWFGLLKTHLLLDTKVLLAVLVGGDRTKVPGTDPSCWELIGSKFSDAFEKPGTLPERAIKHQIDFLPDFVRPAKNYYRISPVDFNEVRKQLDE